MTTKPKFKPYKIELTERGLETRICQLLLEGVDKKYIDVEIILGCRNIKCHECIESRNEGKDACKAFGWIYSQDYRI